MLTQLDTDDTREQPSDRWEEWYAPRLVAYFLEPHAVSVEQLFAMRRVGLRQPGRVVGGPTGWGRKIAFARSRA